jgi:hypothetical protein
MSTPDPSTLATVYAVLFGELADSGNQLVPIHVSVEADEVHEAYRVLICADGAAGPEFIALTPCSADMLANALRVAAAHVRAEIAFYNQFEAGR